jgi:Cu/Ag efflux pump CusA
MRPTCDIIGTAIGGEVATCVYEGQHELIVRFPEQYRNSATISNILVTGRTEPDPCRP